MCFYSAPSLYGLMMMMTWTKKMMMSVENCGRSRTRMRLPSGDEQAAARRHTQTYVDWLLRLLALLVLVVEL